jgi:hypothetical protein
MATLTKPEAIERFHLAFLQVLPQHLPPANYAIKGGANLRLFCESVRRSEDIDLNYVGRAQWNLQPRMDAVMRSSALAALLAIHGLKIVSVNPSKVTGTTGRWKFQLAGADVQVSSRVEFSMRREDRPLYRLEPVSERIAAAAGMRQAVANHYLPTAATEQKVAALALRTETQARDIFDLDFLFARFPAEAGAARPPGHELERARRRVFEVSYQEYGELVLAYLDPAFVSMYRDKDQWERMVLNVASRLDALKAAK